MISSDRPRLFNAIQDLEPDSKWVIHGESYAGIEWLSEDIEQPSEEVVLSRLQAMQHEYDSAEYQRLRAAEYPDFREYLDGLVKGDSDQMQAYIDECLAVKEKYPKPNLES